MRRKDTLQERLESRVVKTEDCWLWQGATAKGYGYIWANGRLRQVHQVTYESVYGPVPEGLELDHLCRVPLCCRPDHLEAVTHLVNVQRGAAAKRLLCPKGHAYEGENLRQHGKGQRCRICHNAQEKLRYRDRRASFFASLLIRPPLSLERTDR